MLKSLAFDAELRDLLESLQQDGPLKDFQSMRQFCLEHPQARMSGRQTFYAFRIDTQRYRYHLRLFPQKGKFHIFCYQANQMRADLPRPDFNYAYHQRAKKKKNRRKSPSPGGNGERRSPFFQRRKPMPNYDLSSIAAVSASAELAHIRANQEPNQDSYNAAWLHGYADALANVADALEPQQELMDAIIGYMGEQHDNAELYDILHEALAMSDKDILSLGFDLPQCREQIQHETSEQKKKRGNHHER